MTTTPSAPPAMDRATLDWVLAEIRTQMAICLAAGESRRSEGSELGLIICQDRANELQRFYDRLLLAYDDRLSPHLPRVCPTRNHPLRNVEAG